MAPYYSTTDDLRREVEDLLGSDGDRETAIEIVRMLREDGLAPYVEPHGFEVDFSSIDIFAMAAKVGDK